MHGRTCDQHYSGAAEYDTIAQIKSALRIPAHADTSQLEIIHSTVSHGGDYSPVSQAMHIIQ